MTTCEKDNSVYFERRDSLMADATKDPEAHVEEKTVKNDKQETYGFELYPERRGEKYKPGFAKIALFGEGRGNLDRVKCEQNVYWCYNKSPIVKLMMSALKSNGCDFDLRRHISCEPCDHSVSGGYDAEYNQVVICENVARSKSLVEVSLAHELIHIFDYCRANLDMKNLEHLACTEIRAANLTSCSFITAMIQGDASFFNVSKTHANCVKSRALRSMLAARKITKEEGIQIINKVFDKCYNDLEPLGRRPRRNSSDIEHAFAERRHYGYMY